MVLSVVILFCLWQIVQSKKIIQDSYSANIKAYAPQSADGDSLLELYAINEDAAAWIEMEDISEAIVQGKDNLEYINQNALKEFSLSGALFMDSLNERDFSDAYTLVYGHSLYEGGKLSALKYYGEEDYFFSHEKGTLYEIQIVQNQAKIQKHGIKAYAFCKVQDDELIIYNTGYANANLEDLSCWIIAHALILDQKNEGDKYLVLSTCAAQNSKERLVLVCTIEE
jgi:sortase B